MSALILDGKALANEIEQKLAKDVTAIKQNHPQFTPCLATILVGEDPASATYVAMKALACARIGMESKSIKLGHQTSTDDLLNEIKQLNLDPHVHGILLQHPVPAHINERACFDAIALEKDVDGVTCAGFGRMALGEWAYQSATPLGIMTLLKQYQIPLKGKRAVVVGRSPILGKPVAMMLLNEHATVTICHSHTQHLPEIIKEADIVVGAVGKPEFIKGAWMKPGTVVIDAGYHPGGIGDIELAAVVDHCAAYTPVPGGVGPMTIAMLMSQTLTAAKKTVR
jgi:methylenetetrahydrofolate dehydrogenase (NADP+)/methenyltetrahydrofolate cyclohydrolase